MMSASPLFTAEPTPEVPPGPGEKRMNHEYGDTMRCAPPRVRMTLVTDAEWLLHDNRGLPEAPDPFQLKTSSVTVGRTK